MKEDICFQCNQTTKEYLQKWFLVYQNEFNLFEMQSLNKRHKITLLASDTNRSSVIVKYNGQKWFLSNFKNTCERC